MRKDPSNLVWLDLETSGIDVETKAILEVAMVITDKDLNVIAEGPELVIYQPDEVLENLDNWCKKHYRASGLIDEVRRSSVSLAQAENELVSFAAQYCPPKSCPLCGNAICFDRRFIIRYMPHLDTLLSYRNVDVSTIKELVGRWYPEVLAGIGNSQTSKHRALSDIYESIDELMHYRKNVFGEACMKDKLWKEVADARKRLEGIAHITPTFTCSSLDQIAKSSVWLKAESLQRTGSFKFRGAYNALSAMPEDEREKGVITHSSGNHGQALALAAKILNERAFVVMPENAPAVKREAVAAYGAMVITCAPAQSSREEKTSEMIEQTSAVFIDSHDDLHVIAGQATAAVELIEQSGPFDILLAPVGGGGLITGTAIAASHLLDGARVIGCEPAGADDAYRSLATGERILDFVPHTVADGLRTPLGELNFEIMQQLVDSIVLVSEEEIVRAMRFVWERMKLIIEPSSAVAVAPLLSGAIGGNGERIGVILSGGNVDLDGFFSLFAKTSANPSRS